MKVFYEKNSAKTYFYDFHIFFLQKFYDTHNNKYKNKKAA